MPFHVFMVPASTPDSCQELNGLLSSHRVFSVVRVAAHWHVFALAWCRRAARNHLRRSRWCVPGSRGPRSQGVPVTGGRSAASPVLVSRGGEAAAGEEGRGTAGGAGRESYGQVLTQRQPGVDQLGCHPAYEELGADQRAVAPVAHAAADGEDEGIASGPGLGLGGEDGLGALAALGVGGGRADNVPMVCAAFRYVKPERFLGSTPCVPALSLMCLLHVTELPWAGFRAKQGCRVAARRGCVSVWSMAAGNSVRVFSASYRDRSRHRYGWC